MTAVDFRQILKQKMKKQEINIPKLARMAELNQATLYNYFSGKSEMAAANLQKLFDVLNITIA